MTANAVANYLKKKILLITVSLLTDKELTKVSRSCHLYAMYVTMVSVLLL